MNFRILKRLAACAFVLALAVFLTRNASIGETFFCAVIGLTGAAAFLLVRPTAAMSERLRMIAIWDLMLPVVVAVYMTAYDLNYLEQNTVRLVFMSIFVVGFGTGVRLIFRRRKG